VCLDALKHWSQKSLNTVDINQRSLGNFTKQKSIPSLLDIKFQGPVQSGFVNSSPLLTDIPPPPVISHPSVPPPPLLPPRRHPAPHSSGLIQSNVPMGLAPPVGLPQQNGCIPPPPNITGGLGAAPTMPVVPQIQSQFSGLGAMPGIGAGPPGIMHLNERASLNMNERPPVNISDRPAIHIGVNDVPARSMNQQSGVNFPPADNSKYGLSYEYDDHRSSYYGRYAETSTYPSQIAPPFSNLSNLSAEHLSYGIGSGDPIMSYVMLRAQELLMNPPLPQMEVDRPPLPQEEDIKEPHMTKTARDREARKRRKERRRLEQSMITGIEPNISNVSEINMVETTENNRLGSAISNCEKAECDDRANNIPRGTHESDGIKDESSSVLAIKEAEESDEPTKEYHFAWDNVDDECLSDVTVSSVHTSDLSSFDEDVDHITETNDIDDDDGCLTSDGIDVSTAAVDSEPVESKGNMVAIHFNFELLFTVIIILHHT